LARMPPAGVLVRPGSVRLGPPQEPGPRVLFLGPLEYPRLHPGERAEDACQGPLPLTVLDDRHPPHVHEMPGVERDVTPNGLRLDARPSVEQAQEIDLTVLRD